MYAHTYLQLDAQLAREGYDEDARGLVGRAYASAVRLFTGRYFPSGTPFVLHVVRTASIVTARGAPPVAVAAALLHSAHAQGDFGEGSARFFSEAKHDAIAAQLGRPTADLIKRYQTLRWNLDTIPALRARADGLDGEGRAALLIRLANDLEHHLDGDILWFGDSETQRVRLLGPVMAEIAEALGHSGLADELMRAHAFARAATVPRPLGHAAAEGQLLGVIRFGGRQKSEVILPKSAAWAPAQRLAPPPSLTQRITRRTGRLLRRLVAAAPD